MTWNLSIGVGVLGWALYFVYSNSPLIAVTIDVAPYSLFPENVDKARLQTSIKMYEGIKPMETLFVGPDNQLYGAVEDGMILQLQPDGKTKVWADIGGRPLGADFDQFGHIVVADPGRGLLRIDKDTKDIHILTNKVSSDNDKIEQSEFERRQTRITYADDLAICKGDDNNKGLIYFSDASNITSRTDFFGFLDVLDSSKFDLLRGLPTGRFLEFNPKTKKTKVLIDGLFFANGVTLAKDESFVLVAETFKFRILRYYLKGPKKGQYDVFIDALPGLPDGISTGENGNIWVAIINEATHPILKLFEMFPQPILRQFIMGMPKFLQPAPEKFGGALEISPSGKILNYYVDETGAVVDAVTSVANLNNKIYFGSLVNHFTTCFEL